MSTSTRRPTAADDVMAAVYQLATRKPQEARARGYARAEWPVYCEGYYCALATALRAMLFALEQRARRQRWRLAVIRRSSRNGRVDMYVVRRLTPVGMLWFAVATRESATYWSRFMRERWGEAVWIERAGVPACADELIDRAEVRNARAAREAAPRCA
jgi:hypothetical protein